VNVQIGFEAMAISSIDLTKVGLFKADCTDQYGYQYLSMLF